MQDNKRIIPSPKKWTVKENKNGMNSNKSLIYKIKRQTSFLGVFQTLLEYASQYPNEDAQYCKMLQCIQI